MPEVSREYRGISQAHNKNTQPRADVLLFTPLASTMRMNHQWFRFRSICVLLCTTVENTSSLRGSRHLGRCILATNACPLLRLHRSGNRALHGAFVGASTPPSNPSPNWIHPDEFKACDASARKPRSRPTPQACSKTRKGKKSLRFCRACRICTYP